MIALGLTTLGVCGALSSVVHERRAEIGLRMGLGTERRTILRMEVRQSLVPMSAGIALGLVGAFWRGKPLIEPVAHRPHVAEPVVHEAKNHPTIETTCLGAFRLKNVKREWGVHAVGSGLRNLDDFHVEIRM